MFDVSSPVRYRLTRPPLVQALAQVQFPVRARLQTLAAIAPVQERLLPLFPYMSPGQVHQLAVVIGPEGSASTGESASTWNFTDDDGWTLILAPGVATLSVDHRYQGVEDFSERFKAVLEALSGPGEVSRCTRLGVRFLNVAETPPGDPAGWTAWFRPELVGWIGRGVLDTGATLVASIMQTQLSARPVGELSGPPVDIQGVVRHGYVPQGTIVPGLPPLEHSGYLLDVDLYIEGPQPLDSAELGEQFGILHGQIDRFFRWALAPAGEDYFGVEERP